MTYALYGAGIGVAIVLIFMFVIPAFLPSGYRMERSTIIKAKPEQIWPYISDFGQGEKWSPWAKMDPNMEKKVEGDPGLGQKYSWVSKHRMVSTGEQTTTVFEPAKVMQSRIWFPKFKMTTDSKMELEPVAEGTKMTWSAWADYKYTQRTTSLFFNAEKQMGPVFEKGFENLKGLVEA